ncbi:acyltransferase [Sphaerotilus mobilis]|uniref:Transferase family hexapeptide repeat protein n=1 Tax=Sphaerotilus mobilis TaxID=47994 RepID=A0A4Q7LUH7_9BURK|nr:CatB-related O-acetyltransferase [Sphaerotilus mobilis]RZS58191.1 transferase family hexapeptide repeat protein [Sphaerotilus mobilis]
MLLAFLRRLQTILLTTGKSRYLKTGTGLHVGKGTRLWAPNSLTIGNGVYLGKQVHIEADASIGDYCLIANRVAIVGRNDHDFRRIGHPVRFSPWIGNPDHPAHGQVRPAVIESDVWIGYGAIIMSGVTIGKGSIIAAGSIVTKNIPEYCIAAGNPAKPIGERFNNQDERLKHERMIRTGRFEFSERGLNHSVIAPGSDET